MTRIAGELLDYLAFWVSILGVINLIVILAGPMSGLGRYLEARTASGRAFRAFGVRRFVPLIVTLLVATYALPRLLREQPRTAGDRALVGALSNDLSHYLDQRRIKRPLIHIAQDVWGFAAGVILEMAKSGRSLSVERPWLSMFGEAFQPTGDEDVRFYFADRKLNDELAFRLDYRLISRKGRVSVYREVALGTVTQLTEPIRVLQAVGVRGDPSWIVDGRMPLVGTPWDSAGALIFATSESSVTLDVPATANGMTVWADGNDSWRLQCSQDRSRFYSVGIVPTTREPGISSRTLYLRRLRGCRELKVSPEAGDGLFSIAEVTFAKASLQQAR